MKQSDTHATSDVDGIRKLLERNKTPAGRRGMCVIKTDIAVVARSYHTYMCQQVDRMYRRGVICIPATKPEEAEI